MLYFLHLIDYNAISRWKSMIKTHSMLVEELSHYGAPNNKITRMIETGELIPLNRGIYETNPSVSPVCLAASIYGPSYVSFEYALSFYGLIPERVSTVTSATFEKNRRKTFTNAFGAFSYRDVPSAVFPLELRIETEGDYAFRIASPEKALCDQLYKATPVGSMKQLRDLLFADWRIEETAFCALDAQLLLQLAPQYRRKNLRMLRKLLEKRK